MSFLLSGCSKPAVTLAISQGTLQAAVEKMFPMDVRDGMPVTLSNPRVILDPVANRLGFQVAVVPETPISRPALPPVPGASSQGVLEVTLTVRFDAGAGAFHGDQPRVEKLELEGLPPKVTAVLGKGAEAALALFLKKEPIYVLSEEDLRQSAGRKLLKSIEVKDGKLQLTLGL